MFGPDTHGRSDHLQIKKAFTLYFQTTKSFTRFAFTYQLIPSPLFWHFFCDSEELRDEDGKLHRGERSKTGKSQFKKTNLLKKKSTLSSSYTVKCHHHTLYEKIIPFKFLDCTEIQSKTQLLSFVTIVSTAIMITIVQR